MKARTFPSILDVALCFYFDFPTGTGPVSDISVGNLGCRALPDIQSWWTPILNATVSSHLLLTNIETTVASQRRAQT